MRRTVALALLALAGGARAADLATPAEALRARLGDAQVEAAFDARGAARLVDEARRTFARDLAAPLRAADPAAAALADRELRAALRAAGQGDERGLAVARANAWTAVLRGANTALEEAVRAGDAPRARDWLAVREFRQAGRFTRLHADATIAVEDLAAGRLAPGAALDAVRADVLDGYQARLADALRDLRDATARRYRTRAAEQAALARGYFELLAPAFAAGRGEAELAAARAELAALPAALPRVEARLDGFRAAPLSERERRLRAGQVTRFLNLVPVEYGRGVVEEGGRVTVTRDIEITEAKTFLAGAASAYADLAPLLPDRTEAAEVHADLDALAADLDAAAAHGDAPGPRALEGRVRALGARLDALFPAAWKGRDANGDLDVIRAQLDALLAAVDAGDYALAETARLDAYATLESGAEARIAVFAPDLKLRLENLFWNGDAPEGFARLVARRADAAAFREARARLDAALAETADLLGTQAAPAAVATNAGVIVFREGLEAVLILAALMGGLRRENVRHLRRPMWWGALLALLATAATWAVMSGTLSLLARFGEKLEAVVSVVAIAVLLLIMNWFFHQVYWTDRMAAFQQTKHRLMGRDVGQWLGLLLLGFTSIYREGFETALFLQSLVLQSGRAPVLGGTALGFLGVVGVGVLVFALQAKLPMKKLLVYTGLMICAVLFVMVGNTVHVLQLVGWFPVHALPGLALPSWASLWFGTYATLEGLALQVLAVGAVGGSYVLAERLKTLALRRKLANLPARS